jgi:hypothetical protein
MRWQVLKWIGAFAAPISFVAPVHPLRECGRLRTLCPAMAVARQAVDLQEAYTRPAASAAECIREAFIFVEMIVGLRRQAYPE